MAANRARTSAGTLQSLNSADSLASGPFPEATVHPGSMLGVENLPLREVQRILRRAAELEAEKAEKRSRRLRHRSVGLLFYEASTRTRVSFELAAKALGAEATLVTAAASSIEKGESLKDTGLTLRALGIEAIVLRHPSSGAARLLAEATGLPVLNAGDGMHEHPSQALLDLRTILQFRFGSKKGKAPAITEKTLRGVTVTVCGDIFHSRVARSNTMLLPRLGARVLLCGPRLLLPDEASGLAPRDCAARVEIRRDLDECLRESQVVMMLRIQKERLQNMQLDLHEYSAAYQMKRSRLEKLAPKALLMHPGPIVRGLEITPEAADSPQSAILRQVANGIAIRMALLARAFRL